MTAPTPAGPPCVLLVDDNQRLLNQLSELLPELDVEVAAAVDRGEKAAPAITAVLAQGVRVDMVVMDVRMPGIGGLEATRQVRAAFPEVQVVLHTAFAGQLDKEPQHLGAFAEVAKGAGIQELLDTIWAGYRETVSLPATVAF